MHDVSLIAYVHYTYHTTTYSINLVSKKFNLLDNKKKNSNLVHN